ncbi:MAG: hypothetical protein K6C12_04085 [Oscillospiraceae bacterium]|nr:hypothetical protein [Oscillospiraceae bacterium]
MKKINIDLDPDPIPVDDYWETVAALKDLNRWYARTASAVRAANKQFLKFDEINRLTAPPDEKTPYYRSGSRSTGTTKTSGPSEPASPSEAPPTASIPLNLAIKDVLFTWDNLNWEQIAMKLVAGFTALGGLVIGSLMGVPLLGLTAGLSFGILMDSAIFNFDGKLSKEEALNAIYAALPAVLGGIAGFILGGPLGAVLGITLGVLFSLKLTGIDWGELKTGVSQWFADLRAHFDERWASFLGLIRQNWQGLKNWWSGLSLPHFTFRLPHLIVEWEELASNSILSHFLGLTAIPHLSVQWYARGGIVTGPTLIGAGEQGREAVIPLERHTEWIRMVAEELRRQLEALSPSPLLSPSALALVPAVSGALLPPAALHAPNEAPDFSGLADTLASAIASLAELFPREQVNRLYLDGRQISESVTRYQRRSDRSHG